MWALEGRRRGGVGEATSWRRVVRVDWQWWASEGESRESRERKEWERLYVSTGSLEMNGMDLPCDWLDSTTAVPSSTSEPEGQREGDRRGHTTGSCQAVGLTLHDLGQAVRWELVRSLAG